MGLRREVLHAILLCVAAAIPAFAAALWHPLRPAWTPDLPGEGEIAYAAAQALEPAPLWIDARSASAYQEAHIPGALPLNLDAWDEQIEAVMLQWLPGVPVVVYCDSRACGASHDVAERLRTQYGFSDVRVLHGGWAAIPR